MSFIFMSNKAGYPFLRSKAKKGKWLKRGNRKYGMETIQRKPTK